MDAELTLTRKARFVRPQNVAYEELIRGVLMSQPFAKLHPYRTIVWKHVRSASSGVDASDRHQVLREPSAETVPILLSLSTALIPQLLLRHLHWLVSVRSVGDCIHVCRRCYKLCLMNRLLQLSNHISVWMTSTSIT